MSGILLGRSCGRVFNNKNEIRIYLYGVECTAFFIEIQKITGSLKFIPYLGIRA